MKVIGSKEGYGGYRRVYGLFKAVSLFNCTLSRNGGLELLYLIF